MKFGFEKMFGGKKEEPRIGPKESIDEFSKKKEAILGVESFEKLYKVLDEIGDIKGSKMLYTPNDLKHDIELVRGGKESKLIITNTFDLRKKVIELLDKEGSDKYKKFE